MHRRSLAKARMVDLKVKLDQFIPHGPSMGETDDCYVHGSYTGEKTLVGAKNVQVLDIIRGPQYCSRTSVCRLFYPLSQGSSLTIEVTAFIRALFIILTQSQIYYFVIFVGEHHTSKKRREKNLSCLSMLGIIARDY